MQAQYKNMATKEEMSEEINNKLKTQIDWSELRKEDLEQLEGLIDNHELLQKLLKYAAADMGQKQLENLIEDWYPGKHVLGRL